MREPLELAGLQPGKGPGTPEGTGGSKYPLLGRGFSVGSEKRFDRVLAGCRCLDGALVIGQDILDITHDGDKVRAQHNGEAGQRRKYKQE